MAVKALKLLGPFAFWLVGIDVVMLNGRQGIETLVFVDIPQESRVVMLNGRQGIETRRKP